MQYPLNVNIQLNISDRDEAVSVCDELTDAFGLVWKKDMDAISDFLLGHIFVDGDILASIWYFDKEAYVEEVLNRGQGMTIQFCRYDTVSLDDFKETIEEAESAAEYISNEMEYDAEVFVAGGHPV